MSQTFSQAKKTYIVFLKHVNNISDQRKKKINSDLVVYFVLEIKFIENNSKKFPRKKAMPK